MNNYDLMQTFLNIIKELAISNPNTNINENIVYTTLMGYNIPPEQAPYKNIQPILNSLDFSSIVRSDSVFTYGHFLVFHKGETNWNEVKIYLPLNQEHIEKGVNDVLNFMYKNGISYELKVADKIRNDNVVIRVNTIQDADLVLNFVNNNKYIKEGLIKTNPFLPNFHGVGMAMDNDHSYNVTVSKIISNYVQVLKTKNKLDELTVENLNIFIKEQAKNINDLNLKDIYDLLAKVTSKEFEFIDFVNHANNKAVDKYEEDYKRITNPAYYFERAIKVTNEKYPQNVIVAIEKYINGDASYFTNADNVRLGLIKYLSPSDVVNTMRNKLIAANVPVPSNTDKLINSYLNVVLNHKKTEEIVENTPEETFEYAKSTLRHAYIATLKKYGIDQANGALKLLIQNGDAKHFTNDKKFFRDKLKSIVKKFNVKKLVLSAIDLTNLDTNDIDEMVNRYSNIFFEPTKGKKNY